MKIRDYCHYCQDYGLYCPISQKLGVQFISIGLVFCCDGSEVRKKLKMEVKIHQTDENIRELP